jgi:hypothetical protein
MANKIFKDYQGESVKINGVCYKFFQETTANVNTSPNDIEGVFASCLECALESSSSSHSSSSESIGNTSSSTSSGDYSESTSESSGGYTTSSSTSSESVGNTSSSSSSESTESTSSESIGNISSSSESVGNESSSQSLGLNCASAEILDIRTLPGGPDGKYGVALIFAPGPPLSNLAEGTVCINSETEGTLDTGGAINAIGFRVPNGEPVPYSIGEVVEVCEGECCFLGNFTKRCEYVFQESTLTWELVGSDDQRTIACSLDFKCIELDRVLQIHQFETLEQRNMFVCPQNPIGDPPEDCKSDCCLREVHFMARCINPNDPDESSSESSDSPQYIICKELADAITSGCPANDSSSSESDGIENKNRVILITSPAQYAGAWGIQVSTFNANASNEPYILFTQAGANTSCAEANIVETVTFESNPNFCWGSCADYWASLNSSSSESESSEGLSESSSEPAGGDPPAINCSGDPDMIVKITADPGDLPISWCGKTWVNSSPGVNEVLNGHEARVCPSGGGWVSTKYTSNFSPKLYRAKQEWNRTGQLKLIKAYEDQQLFGGNVHIWTLNSILTVKGLQDKYRRFDTCGGCIGQKAGSPWIFATFDTSDLGPALPAPVTTMSYSNYDIHAGMFTSYTDINGTVYAWRKGDNWPAP